MNVKIQYIHTQLRSFHKQGKKLFVSSSFQTHSIPLLHIMSTANVPFDTIFINTGFHFPETILFRDELKHRLNLNVIDLRSHVPKMQQKDADNQFYYVSDPDYCCFLNKTKPMESILMTYDVWVNGVRADQSAVRKQMKTLQPAPFDTLRYHPMLDWSAKEIYEYRKAYDLPEHPLDAQGYQSIGCAPCTRKIDLNNERDARWFGMNKTECGLHTDLIQ